MINSVFDEFWKITHLIVAQWRIIVAAAYCVKSLYFSLWNNSPKFKMLSFFESRQHHLLESIAKIAHFYILTLPGGVTLTKFKKKKSFFERWWGENGHNSLNIRVSALKSLALDRESNFG